jgi:hypothetical protein
MSQTLYRVANVRTGGEKQNFRGAAGKKNEEGGEAATA